MFGRHVPHGVALTCCMGLRCRRSNKGLKSQLPSDEEAKAASPLQSQIKDLEGVRYFSLDTADCGVSASGGQPPRGRGAVPCCAAQILTTLVSALVVGPHSSTLAPCDGAERRGVSDGLRTSCEPGVPSLTRRCGGRAEAEGPAQGRPPGEALPVLLPAAGPRRHLQHRRAPQHLPAHRWALGFARAHGACRGSSSRLARCMLRWAWIACSGQCGGISSWVVGRDLSSIHG